MNQISRQIDLMIVGAQKAGTTSLLRYLSQHPQIYVHPYEEMVFFRKDVMYEKGYNIAWKKYFSKYKDNKIIVAKDVMSIYSGKALKRLKEHNHNIILVVLLRNPISRAYSAYWFARRRGWEFIKSFEEALKAEEERLKTGGWDKWYQNAYIYNSIYYPHIKNCFEIFSKSNVKIYLTEWLKTDSVRICKELFSMLNIDQNFIPETRINYNPSALPRSDIIIRIIRLVLSRGKLIKEIILRLLPETKVIRLRNLLLRLNEVKGEMPPMNPATKKWLLEYFKPHNLSLQKITGIDVSHWNDE
jgi:hypothetical protein